MPRRSQQLSLGKLEETTIPYRPSYYIGEDYPAGPEI